MWGLCPDLLGSCMFHRLLSTVRAGVSAAVAGWKDSLLAERSAALGIGGGEGSGFGTPNERTAMGVAAFYAAVRFISEVAAALPILVQEREPGTDRWKTIHGHGLEFFTNCEPNVDQVGFSFHQLRYVHQLTYADTLSVIRWDVNRGTPSALWPVHPQAFYWKYIPGRGRVYTIQLNSGAEELDRSEVLHVTGMSLDGVNPLSPLKLFASSIALSTGIRSNAAGYHQNIPRPGMLVTSPRPLEQKKYDELQRRLNENYNNARSGKALLLEGGMTATPYHLPFAEMQILELLAANEDDIERRVFNMPPKELKGHERNDFLARYTLFPFLTRDDQVLTRQLIPTIDKGRLRLWHDLSVINEMDLRTKFESYRVGVMGGFLKINEVRGWEGLEPDPKGNDLYLPQSVYGKPGTTPTVNPMPAARSLGKPLPEAVDPVFHSLLSDTLGGLFQRAVHQVDKLVGKPTEYRSGIEKLFAKQRELFGERLREMPDVRRRLVLEVVGEHEAALLALDGSPDLVQRAASEIQSWPVDAKALALTLLES